MNQQLSPTTEEHISQIGAVSVVSQLLEYSPVSPRPSPDVFNLPISSLQVIFLHILHAVCDEIHEMTREDLQLCHAQPQSHICGLWSAAGLC